VGVAVEAAVALEEVVLHVTHHPFGLAFGSGALRPAGLGDKAVMVGQCQETCVEGDLAIRVMTNHRRLLVVHQDTVRNAIKVPEGLHQRFVGVLGILTWTRPDVKVAGVTQHIHRDVDGTDPATDFGPELTPVMLELLARVRLVSDRLFTGAKRSLGLNVLADQCRGAAVPLLCVFGLPVGGAGSAR